MQFGYGLQKKKLMFFTSVMSVCVLLITAYILIFGKFGFPKFGVAGLGYATAVQFTFFFLFSTLFFRFNKNFAHFDLFKYRVHQHWEYFTHMLKIGFPIFVQMGGEMLSFSLGGIMIGWLGIPSLAAFQIVNQYYFLIVIPIFSLSQASGILVGQARGSEQFHEIKKLSHASFAIALTMGLLVAGVFLLFPKNLASFYINVTDRANSETLHLAVLIFTVVAFTQLFDGLRNILIGVLRGLFDTRFSMYMSLFTVWLISMPLAYIFAFSLHFGVVGYVAGGLLGMLFGAMIMSWRWHMLIKKY
jgi:MATE family multidrug resistance protein